jgi:ribosomal-protein-alanine N-acetyltransferase
VCSSLTARHWKGLHIPAPDVVTTERLTTRALTLDDIDPWMEFMLGSGSLDYLPFVAATREGAEWWIRRQLGRYERDGCGLMAVLRRDTGDLAGQCGLLRQEIAGKPDLEVGYHLLPRARGVGYATEAARGFIDHALSSGMAASVVSIIHVGNIASQRVAERNGLVREFSAEMYGAPHYVYRTTPA